MTFADLNGMVTKGKAFTPYSNIIAIALAIAFLGCKRNIWIFSPGTGWYRWWMGFYKNL